jgi:hypothetical protein
MIMCKYMCVYVYVCVGMYVHMYMCLLTFLKNNYFLKIKN